MLPVSAAPFESNLAPGIAHVGEPGVTAPRLVHRAGPRYVEAAKRAITPLLEQVAVDKSILLLLRADTGAVAWADPALDLTGEVIKRLDAAPKPPKAP